MQTQANQLNRATTRFGEAFSWPVFLVITLLISNTVSGSADTLTIKGSSDPIMTQTAFLLLKAVGRGTSFLILSYLLYLQVNCQRFALSGKLLLPFLCFAGLAVCSTAWSPLKSTTLFQSASFLLLILLAWVIAVRWRCEGDTSRLLCFCSVLLIFVSAALIVFHFAFPRYGALTRLSTGLFHATAGGSTGALGVLILTSSAILWDWRWPRYLLFPGMALHLACMTIGGNRFSFVALLIPLGLVLCVAASRFLIAQIVIAGSLFGLIYLLFDPGLKRIEFVQTRFTETLSQGQTSAQIQSLSGREEMWAVIWENFLVSPFLGHGFFVTSRTGSIYVWDHFGNWTAHNVWLQSLASMGILGTLLLTVGFGFIGLNLFRPLVNQNHPAWHHSVFSLALLSWIFIWGLLNEAFLGPLLPESVIFAIVLGLGTASCIHYVRPDCGSEVPTTTLAALLPKN